MYFLLLSLLTLSDSLWRSNILSGWWLLLCQGWRLRWWWWLLHLHLLLLLLMGMGLLLQSLRRGWGLRSYHLLLLSQCL